MTAVSTAARHLPTFRANEQRLASLADVCRELNALFSGRVEVARNLGERPPACTVRLTTGGLFATFGVIDATWFWTFDGGESCHYAKDKEVMRRLLTSELRSALSRGNLQ
jgi:hypothetical protein